METVTRNDLKIIIKAGIQMAQQDSDMHETEEKIIQKMLEIGKIDMEEVNDMTFANQSDNLSLSEKLSSTTSKKLFLLSLATVALADENLEDHELEMLDSLTKKLNVGKVKIRELSYQSCEAMVLKMISKIKPLKAEKKKEPLTQYSDIDLIMSKNK